MHLLLANRIPIGDAKYPSWDSPSWWLCSAQTPGSGPAPTPAADPCKSHCRLNALQADQAGVQAPAPRMAVQARCRHFAQLYRHPQITTRIRSAGAGTEERIWLPGATGKLLHLPGSTGAVR